MSVPVHFNEEAQFVGFGDGTRSGPWIRFRLSESAQLEPWRGEEGQRYRLVAVKIGDDDRPVDTAASVAATKRERMGPLCEWAVFRCAEEPFQRWITPVYDRAMGGDGRGTGDIHPDDVGGPEGFARHALLLLCDITSRKELDTNTEAAKRLHQLIRLPYAAWLKETEKA